MYKKDTNYGTVGHPNRWSRLPRRIACAASVFAILATSQVAMAIPPTFSVIAPNEFALPIPKPDHGITFFINDSTYTGDDTAFDNNGNTVNVSPSGNSLLTIARIGHIFSLSALPNVGMYWEFLQPAAYVQRGGTSVTGLVDPLVGGGVYINPVKNLTLGTEQFFQLPIGSNELSNHYFVYYPQLFGDYSYKHFGIDFLAGAAFKTNQRNNGNIVSEGNDYYADLRLRYELNHYLTPYFSYDFTTTNSRRYKTVAPTNTLNTVGDVVPSSNQNNVGGGLQIFLRKDHLSSLSIAYSHGLAGKNAIQTNGVLAEFLYLFP